jgi:multisubunit Na+/H+ antiporter MnhF subunit
VAIMKKRYFVIDIILRAAFLLFAGYLISQSTSFSNIVGLSMIAFNIVTMLFDANFPSKNSKSDE